MEDFNEKGNGGRDFGNRDFGNRDFNRRDRNDRGGERNDRGGDRGDRRDEIAFSKKVRAGKRTYFLDVKTTRGNDYFICMTESKKSFEGHFVKNKIFLYKEDINKFMEALNETVAHMKTELMPDYNFDEFNRPEEDNHGGGNQQDQGW
jgi:hypothetical protein